MRNELQVPIPRLTMITLGVGDMRASIAFYEALGFARKFRATGEVVAFFETGGTALGLFPWDQLAQDVTLPEHPRPQAFRGATLAWNCRTTEEVDAVLAFAISKGAALLKSAHETDYGGYSGYFADPRSPLGSRCCAQHRSRRRPSRSFAGLNRRITSLRARIAVLRGDGR